MINIVATRMTPVTTLVVVLLTSVGLFFCNVAGAYAMQAKAVDETAKVIFSRNGHGDIQALVIPHTAEGLYPRSGWILCRIESSDLRNDYGERLADKKQMEGYFRVRYRVTSEDGSFPVLRYFGVIEDISPWEPNFPTDFRQLQ